MTLDWQKLKIAILDNIEVHGVVANAKLSYPLTLNVCYFCVFMLMGGGGGVVGEAYRAYM